MLGEFDMKSNLLINDLDPTIIEKNKPQENQNEADELYNFKRAH